MISNEEKWIQLIDEIYFVSFDKIKTIVYPRLLHVKEIPTRESIGRTQLVSRLLTEIRRWNDSVTAELSCVMRLNTLLFEKIKDSNKRKEIYLKNIRLTELAFYQPTVTTIEVGMDFIFKMMKLMMNKTFFLEVDNELIEETIQTIHLISRLIQTLP